MCERERLTKASVVRELLIDLLHPLDVEAAALCVVYHGFGIVDSHNAVRCLLNRFRCIPRLVDVTAWVVLQLRNISPVQCNTSYQKTCRGANIINKTVLSSRIIITLKLMLTIISHQ